MLEEIAQLVSEKNNTTDDNDDGNDNICDVEIIRPSKAEVKGSLEILRTHLLFVDGADQQLNNLHALENFIDQSYIACQRQSHITDYFT